MILRAVSRINLRARTYHFIADCRFIGRHRLASAACVNGAAVLQACSIESCCRQSAESGARGYHNTSTTTDWFPYRTLRIALAAGLVFGLGSAGYSVARAGDGLSVLCQSADDVGGTVQAGRRRPDLPDYRLNDISEHRTADRGIWVTFGDGVYDITDFMVGHPGGDKISLAAGGSVEPFWDLYAIHKTDHVAEILETLRIGNIHPDDVSAVAAAVAQSSSDDPYSHEPRRHPALRVNASKPFNAETPLQLLVDEFITPNELFYVRNHLPVPRSAVDDAAAAKMKGKSASGSGAEIEVSGEGLRRPVNLSIADLRRRFASHTVTTTMPCAGNRRSNMKADDDRGSVRGLPWGIGAVGTARWTGVLLSDVLQWAGAREDQVSHVLFQGRDTDHEGQPYETSIPAATAFDPRRDVLLAYEMNGRELPVDHGYPLRVIVPGTVGARQVKWLRRIVLSHDESQSFWQQKDYKTVNPSTSWEAVDLSQVMSIQEYPVQAAICSPVDGTSVDIDDGEVTVRGYAMSGGGRGIQRVDVTLDGGLTWHAASLQAEAQPYSRRWAWTVWEAVVPLPATTKTGQRVEIAAKATDTAHNTQPETDIGIWNIRGLLENRWHRVHVDITTSQ